jgi:hypothetical protein
MVAHPSAAFETRQPEKVERKVKKRFAQNFSGDI